MFVQNTTDRIILASGSERRRALLGWLGIDFEVVVSQVEEDFPDQDPRALVYRLSGKKAKAVADKRDKGMVIGADTVGFIDGEILGKPQDKEDAVRMLRKMSGRTHWVYTGVAVIDAQSGKQVADVEKTGVRFRDLGKREILAYIETGEPLDKGASYAIQMGASGFVEEVDGSYTNVVGLPLLSLEKLLKKQGYGVEKDIPGIIFERTGYRS